MLDRRSFLRLFVAGATVTVMMPIFQACGTSINAEDPPVIQYGKDLCDECSMIINDDRFACGYFTDGEVIRKFDDIGGLVEFSRERSEKILSIWVHDMLTKKWILAGSAFFVVSPNIQSPMGYGIAAFSTKSAAEQMKLKILSWKEIVAVADRAG